MNPLEQENRSLKRTLRLLISKAEHNRDVLNDFKKIELELLSCNSLTALLEMILTDLRRNFRLDAVSLVLFDPEQAARDLVGDYRPAGTSSRLEFTESYRPLKALYSEPPRPQLGIPGADTRTFAFAGDPRIKSCALLPLARQQLLIGSLHLGSHDPDRYSQQAATDYLAHLGSIISVCVENCVNQETLRRLSIIDMLTKVNNRRSFDQELLREISRSGRSQLPLSCLFVDLDHFKQVNDRHGHQTGDHVLTRAAQGIRQKLRQTDFIARYGGEEFAILLPGCDRTRALTVAESIRGHIRDTKFYSEEGQPVAVTLSIGVSTVPPRNHDQASLQQTARQLVACADRGVYQAKTQGRDRVVTVDMSEPEDSDKSAPTGSGSASIEREGG